MERFFAPSPRDAVPATPPPPPIPAAFDPQADAVLAAFGKFYAGLQSFQADLKSTNHIEANGMDEQMESDFTVAMSRPNSFALIHQTGMVGGSLLCDGKTVFNYQPMMKKYTSTSAPARLSMIVDPMDLALATGGNAYALPPLVATDPAKNIKAGAKSDTYVGQEQIDGVSAHHLRLSAPSTVTDLWIETGEAPLLLKMITATDTKVPAASLPGQGAGGSIAFKCSMISAFSNWQTDKPIPPETFAFQPPADAKLVGDFTEGLVKEEPVHPLVGKPAPDFQLNDLDGHPISLSSLKGKVVVLDFWATWCPPCCKALPIVSSVAMGMQDRGVAFYAVNLKETADVIRSFQSDNGLSIPVLLDADGKAANLYQAKAIPETVLIDRDGVIQAVHVGYRGDIQARLAEQLNVLLDGKSLVNPSATPSSTPVAAPTSTGS